MPMATVKFAGMFCVTRCFFKGSKFPIVSVHS